VSEGREFGVHGKGTNAAEFCWRAASRASTLGWVGLLLMAMTGCTSTAYSVNSSRAVRALEHAKRARAAEHARYELTLAEAYLAKAREESAQAAYQDAIQLARASKQNAEKAVERARQAREGTAK
jgi:hypothetical protein